ncbi:hypothetical protein EYC84_000991 [Monilinia fructicola]|uniref:Uncharacterized protein n=1 Tax=Monilinia fructicola TaxID=38448 RepID=A0A5M9JMY0_MONFR|nr:hypothetical protein EYC84_000991 [Monilinia fructicola]
MPRTTSVARALPRAARAPSRNLAGRERLPLRDSEGRVTMMGLGDLARDPLSTWSIVDRDMLEAIQKTVGAEEHEEEEKGKASAAVQLLLYAPIRKSVNIPFAQDVSISEHRSRRAYLRPSYATKNHSANLHLKRKKRSNKEDYPRTLANSKCPHHKHRIIFNFAKPLRNTGV